MASKKHTIEGKRGNLFNVEPGYPVIVGIDTEHKSTKDHPLYDPRVKLPVDKALVKNIKIYGVIDPIKVCKDGDDVVVVDGRQRLRAARVANDELVEEGKEPISVPLILKRGTEATLYGVMISANENRQDDDVLLKAQKAARLLDMGHDEEEVAIAFGVTAQAVRNWLALLDCSSNVRKAVEKGEISATAAAKLSSLKREDQDKELEEMIASGATTVAHAEHRARSKKNGANGAAVVSNPAPGKKAVLKLAKYLKDLAKTDDEEYLSEEFLKGARWAIGDLPTATVGNLTALLEESSDVKLSEPKPSKGKGRKGKGGKKAPPRVTK